MGFVSLTGAWKGGALANASSIGAVTSGTSSGTVLAGATTTYTKGAWTQLIASTATDIAWILISAEILTTGSFETAVDIGVGASGSEIVVVSNLNFGVASGASFLFPLSISAGTRIAARFSGSIGNTSLPVLLQAFQDTYQSVGVGSSIDTIGFSSTLNLGTAVDPGATANTKGAYSQITATTVSDYAGFFLVVDVQGTTTGTVGSAQWLIDIAVGAAGSEVVILPNLYQVGYTATNPAQLYIPAQNYLPIQIGAGSRIAARSQCTTATSPDRLLGVTVYGVRL